MKTPLFRFSLALAAGSAAWLATPAYSQIEVPPVGVAIRIWASGQLWYEEGESGSLALSGTFLPSTPGGSDGEAYGSATAPSGESVAVILGTAATAGFVRIEPLKAYTLTIDATALYGGQLDIAAPAGYQVVIDNKLRTRMAIESSSPVVFQVKPLNLRRPGLAGMVSPVADGEVDFRLSLGDSYWGASLGELALVDTGFGSDWSVLINGSLLSYEPTSEHVNAYRTGNVIRQIAAPQVAVDIVPAGGSMSYMEIRCYHPSQVIGGYYATKPYQFSGPPITQYRLWAGGTNLTIQKFINSVGTSPPVYFGGIIQALSLSRTGSWPNHSWLKQDWNTTPSFAPIQSPTETHIASTGSGTNRTEVISVR
ncbi:MAG: hypothetical protein FJ399_10395, partial [Verrucomicrobia bacterium]|nr:hypothetical protein [Verrucomicrobiota bacterium]